MHKCPLCEERDLLIDAIDMTRSVSIGPYTLYEGMQGQAWVIDERTDENVSEQPDFAAAIRFARSLCPGRLNEEDGTTDPEGHYEAGAQHFRCAWWPTDAGQWDAG